ncbi:carboxymuconolactone decarboxylase family protein [Amycolatopsis sp. NPDC050768]|uniref:carboxymuconolactone decarboxylase family protein n=1 Tax=Amycolatopsis sp. NPDC050768 TaxID=3154839 RepID=UPI0033D16E41
MTTTITPVEPEAATGVAKELLAEVNKALGLVPNMTKVMANSPALLKAYLALSGAAAGGALNAGIRERLAIATAQLNGCEYCLSAHTFIGENIAYVPAGELAAARKAESDEAHVQALLELSNEIASNTGNVGEDALSKARAAGVTDEEIGELVLNISLNVLTNYFNVLAGVENDWPVVSL